MAKADSADKPPERHPYGPRAIGAVLPAVLRPAYRKRSPATAQVLLDWQAIVGPALAACVAPRRLSAGTLTLACSGTTALELQHQAPQLLARINAHFGRQVASRLAFVQDGAPPATAALPAVPARADAAARARVAALPPGELRDALERLGRAALAGTLPD